MIPELKLIGDPLLSVIAFQGTTVKTYAVADLLTKRGWLLNILQFPPAIHMAVTLPSVQSVGELLSDIQEVVDILKKDPSAGNGETAAIYGTAASVPDRSIIKQVTYGFLDALTK
jgi:sphinganine-1-phosphate aldolase